MWISAFSGGSYGLSMPVKFLSSPARAFAYRPLTSRRSASASGVSTKTSKNSPSGDHSPDHVAFGAERRNEGGQHDQAGVGHQPRDFADSADILNAVGLGEAEVAVEAVADIVAVEQEGVAAAGRELLFNQIGDGRLARARKGR